MVYSQVMDISLFDKIVPNSSQVDCTVKTAADMGDYDFFYCSWCHVDASMFCFFQILMNISAKLDA
jgi:hypothetical protein